MKPSARETPAGGTTTISGTVVDVVGGRMFPGRVIIAGDRIAAVQTASSAPPRLVLPGFVDAHVHVESSLLAPDAFARAAVRHGTVGAVADPHEIANVLGVDGVHFMTAAAGEAPLAFGWSAPSCVPSSPFETAGGALDAEAVTALLDRPEITHLGEVMNVPGVLSGEAGLLAMIAAARQRGKPVDGHAPGLRGAALQRYAAAGITTDHETLDQDDAREELAAGMRLLIRGGSAGGLIEDLLPLIDEHPDCCMFCTDDVHPDALQRGHIDRLVRTALGHGVTPMHVFRAASLNPVRHYRLPLGLLQAGDPADFIVAENINNLRILETWRSGRRVAWNGSCPLPHHTPPLCNRFEAGEISTDSLRIPWTWGRAARVIEVIEGKVITGAGQAIPAMRSGCLAPDPERDLLKLVVLNRYHPAAPAQALVRGFGLTRGALASSVAHDAHNIIAVGASDEDLAAALRAVTEARGGLAAAANGHIDLLPLPVAGLMSPDTCPQVAGRYEVLNRAARRLGSCLPAPYMALSFLALPVIPRLKLTDLGLFDAENYRFVNLEL